MFLCRRMREIMRRRPLHPPAARSNRVPPLAFEKLEDRIALSPYLLVTDYSQDAVFRYDGVTGDFVEPQALGRALPIKKMDNLPQTTPTKP
jgi:hypothetical protein